MHPPLPLAAGTLARRRLVSGLHPGRLCAAGSSRSSTPDALAPQARLDPPPGWRARRGLLPSARTAGCVVAFVIAELRAPSRSSTAGGATPHASQSCSREPPPPPLACPPRAAPLSASRPRPRRARLPTPAPRPRPIGSRGRRRGCSSARTSPPTGLEHGREQAQGPRSCTHGRGERPRTWPRDRVSVCCHVLSCRLNTTCVHVCMFLPSHSAETVPDEPALPACQPSRIAPLPSASPERTGCARPALSIPSETLPGGRLPANRNQNLREKRRCAPARRQKVNSPEFLAICGRASSSRRRRHDSDAADRLPFRQGISGAARQATAPLLMTIGRRAGSL